MKDTSGTKNALFRQFEGLWLMSPSGIVACAKVVNGQLLIPHSKNNEGSKLAGHYFDCRVVGKTLFSRFERLDFYAQEKDAALGGEIFSGRPAMDCIVKNLSLKFDNYELPFCQ
jgi:hypothetical protein